jgi:hypothetical protein
MLFATAEREIGRLQSRSYELDWRNARMATANFDLLVEVARHLQPLLSEVVFLGGCTTELFVTDPGAAEVRPTLDVDVVVEITSQVEYWDFSERLRRLGFSEDIREGAPRCRWLINEKQLDVMPIDERILGYSNPWYAAAIESARPQTLAPDLHIQLISAPYFIATKIVAFKGRGQGDYRMSRDLEDIVTSSTDARRSLMRSKRKKTASELTSPRRWAASLTLRRFSRRCLGMFSQIWAVKRASRLLKSVSGKSQKNPDVRKIVRTSSS